MLDDLHKHVLLSGFLDIESRLRQMENLLGNRERRYPLNEYIDDLSPDEARTVIELFARIREKMHDCLKKHHIPVDVRRISLHWALQCGVTMLDVALADMGPERLRGYGGLDEAGKREIRDIQHELQQLIDQTSEFLGTRSGQRTANLPAKPAGKPAAAAGVSLDADERASHPAKVDGIERPKSKPRKDA
jgi:hypothetical protein